MKNKYILYNPHANNGRGEEQARELEKKLAGSKAILVKMTDISDYADFIADIDGSDELIICGGDGTLNRFINDTSMLELANSVYYYPAGSGNDFACDIGASKDGDLMCIDKYLADVPHVFVNGMERIFLNGVGYGVDGYCCEVGDELRRKSNKPVNYTSIAIKGLLFHYRRANATVTVDGDTREYKGVWIAPTMNGRFYGGGMMPTPAQDRLDSEGKLSLMIFHRSGKLRTLMIFPSIFKGEHVKNTKFVEVLEGKDITVRFDRPTALQIDGETVLGVTEYRAVSGKTANIKQAEAVTV